MQPTRRLLDHFVPDNYSVTLDINRPDRTFTGTVVLSGTSAQAGSIWLHAKQLSIISCDIDGAATTFQSGENDELELICDSRSDQHHVITIAFEGTINDQMHGMYPCYYQHDGKKHELIATQFESHHAREVFPCIDEPAAKATFDVTLLTEQDVTVLGNMPVLSQTKVADKLSTTFETTPRMSSYLLAWVYGTLHKKSARTKSDVEVNIWATPAQSPESLDFALDIATRTIDFFDDYFGVPYPLAKSDHVALPDFSSGAMENWGLITYREVALLAEPGSVSVSSKHRIAAVIAHELSHQWFGNLVTMKWWNNLWLNESFANFMEYIAIDAIEPSWNVWLDFAGYETVSSLRRDATDGVQAVQTDVHHPDEISTLFDPAIVYAKGSRLLHMLERHIGQDAFKQGLRQYFKKHAYQNTSETDLWEALTEASGKDVSALMTPWISQPGYPVVAISDTTIAQSQFFIGDHEESSRTWPIPLGATSPSVPELLSERATAISVPVSTLLNKDDSSHFITHYSPEMITARIEAIKNGEVGPINRLQFLHEQTLLARGTQISSSSLVPLLTAYENETAESVWDIIALTVGELKKFVEDDEPSERALKDLCLDLARPLYTKLGWNQAKGESETDTKLRATVLGLMLYGEDDEAIKTAAQLAEREPSAIDPELRALVYGTAIRHATNDNLFDTLLALYQSTASAELQQDIASGLTSTRVSDQSDRLLTLLSDPGVIRSQDVARWFIYLIRNRYSRSKAWDWLRNNWSWIETTFAGDKSYDDYPRYAVSGLKTKQELEEYKKFFTPLRVQKSLTRVIDMAISELTARVNLIERDSEAVRHELLNR